MADMKTSTVLRKSLKVLEENGWTQGEYARNKYRHRVKPTSPNAVKYCAYGAVCNVLDFDGEAFNNPPEFTEATRFLRDAVSQNHEYHMYLDDFNDDEKTTFADVRRVFKAAIKAAKRTES